MATHNLTRTKSALLAGDRKKLQRAQELIMEVIAERFCQEGATDSGTEGLRQYERLVDARHSLRSALAPGLV